MKYEYRFRKYCCDQLGIIDQLSKRYRCELCNNPANEIHTMGKSRISICDQCHDMIGFENGEKTTISKQKQLIAVIKEANCIKKELPPSKRFRYKRNKNKKR